MAAMPSEMPIGTPMTINRANSPKRMSEIMRHPPSSAGA